MRIEKHEILRIHKKHHVSKETLLYMKEYGPKSHLVHEIVKESIWILLIATVLTSIAGLALRSFIGKFSTLIPLLIIIPALNDMVGDMASIIASKFTTGLFLGKVKKNPWQSPFVRNLLFTNAKVAVGSAVYLSLLSLVLSAAKGYAIDMAIAAKIILISVIASVSIVSILFAIAIIGGMKIFNAKEDPNNFLVPLSTSIGDMVTIFVVSLMVVLLF